jgi:hypothetical protein
MKREDVEAAMLLITENCFEVLESPFEIMSVAVVFTMRSPEGDLVTRLHGFGDISLMHISMADLGKTSGDISGRKQVH